MAGELAGALPAGARLGRYECIRRIAVGGMAELYLGRVVGPSGFEKLVAIKRILPQRTEDGDFVKMFVHEARIAASLDHANVVKVMDFGEDGDNPYLVMEYLHGRDLTDLRRELRGALPMDAAIAIAIAVAHGLHYVHERSGRDGRPLGLVHRDISPSNVFVCFSGDVKVVDFGIAKATESTMGTRSGALKGKLGYMSPEQCVGAAVDRRSDIHALGNLLYGLTTGRRMYTAPNEFGLLNRVAKGEFERPSAVCPEYPAELEAIVLRAVALRPEDRWATAKAFGDALEGFAMGRGLRVGASVIADFMAAVFGAVTYPTIEPSVSGVALDATTPSVAARRTRVRTRVAVAAALGVGAVLGVWLGPSAAPAVVEADEDAGLIEQTPTVATPPVADADPSRVETPPPDVVQHEGAPSLEAVPQDAATKNRKASRRPKRARADRQNDTKPRPAHSEIFLPPSKRE